MKVSRAGRGSRLRVGVGVGREKGRCAVQRSRRRGCSPAALLAATLLMNSCIQLTDAANTVIPITLSPPKPTKGQNIFLTPGLDHENFTSCGWYRGTVLNSENLRLIISSQSEYYIKGGAYTGREKLCANCSLHIKHCKTEDKGMYTIIMKGSMIAFGEVNLNVSDGLDLVPTNQPEGLPVELAIIAVVGGIIGGTLILTETMLWIYILTYNRCRKDKNSAPDEASSEPPFSVCDNTFPSMGDCSEPITYINDACNLKVQNSSPAPISPITWSSHPVIPAGDIPSTTPFQVDFSCDCGMDGSGDGGE